MKCTRCGERVTQDTLDRVADSFDVDFEYPTCWDCATEIWREREQTPHMVTAKDVKAMFAATDLSRDMAEARKPFDAWSNPSAGAAQSGGQQIIKPGGRIAEILSCGHDVSNCDVALESGAVFCRLCDLQGRCRDAEGREKELFDELEMMSRNYNGAAKLVADMHRAAMGCVCGPVRGPVEDVADLRQRFDSLIEAVQSYCGLDGKDGNRAIQAWFAQREKPDWRVGHNCKPKLRTHPLSNCAHNCVVIGARASSLHKDGLLLIVVDDGRQLLEPADEWMTA